MSHSDKLHQAIVITWPKSRSLSSYLTEVNRAKDQGKQCFYRIRGNPLIPYGARCYHIWDGYIRGYMPTLGVRDVDDTTVVDPITGNYWPAGRYLVRSPEWTPIVSGWHSNTYRPGEDWKMQGFRGYRYFDLEPEYV